MATVRSHRFIEAKTVASTYTVPTGHRALVKVVTFYNGSGATRTIRVQTNTAGAGFVDVYVQTLANGASVILQLGIVCEAGDVLRLTADTAAPVASAHGVDFTL